MPHVRRSSSLKHSRIESSKDFYRREYHASNTRIIDSNPLISLYNQSTRNVHPRIPNPKVAMHRRSSEDTLSSVTALSAVRTYPNVSVTTPSVRAPTHGSVRARRQGVSSRAEIQSRRGRWFRAGAAARRGGGSVRWSDGRAFEGWGHRVDRGALESGGVGLGSGAAVPDGRALSVSSRACPLHSPVFSPPACSRRLHAPVELLAP